MAKIEGVSKQVIEKSEWAAISTAGPDGPHVVGCWGHDLRALGVDGDELFIPAGKFYKTEENLKHNPRVELLFASREISRANGQGQGCTVFGTAAIQTSGSAADAAKARFPWARGVLVVRIETTQTHL
ncbi:MAG: pyridoxamine 5'-phosphate oxidase family protein [Pirellulales bacterium]|nr:pyridoxamine 5'-phosphate oxidase family protein [Pirellulales bacterium]